MKRWMVAVLAAAGSLLLYPLQAAAQNYEPGTKDSSLICGYFPEFSFAIVESRSPKKRATCIWKCIYQMPGGRTHVNAGTRTLAPGHRLGMNATKKVAPGIASKVSGVASCN